MNYRPIKRVGFFGYVFGFFLEQAVCNLFNINQTFT